MPIVELDQVSKLYRAARGSRALLGRGGIRDWFGGGQAGRKVALEAISFDVEAGESVGIIGANGSGKSTLLKIIAGVTTPTTGHVRVYGRVASLLELGAGFHPMLTGRENIYLNAGMHGVRHAQVDAMMEQIIEFSGIGSAIENPVATYSSGMYVRLGFAVATHTNPDIFLVDEVLAVGDEEFQRRCRNRIGELMEMGKTLLFVSHDLSIVNILCKRVILLSQGKMILRDSPTKAIDFYLRQVGAPEGLHTLRDGPLEVILCNGRISIFYDQTEVTSAAGLHEYVFYRSTVHTSGSAQWTIVEGSETRCVARGRLGKLGLDLLWTLELDDGKFHWTVEYETAAPLSLSGIETFFKFHKAYTRWIYDGESSDFHALEPTDVTAVPMRAAEMLCERAGLLASDEAEHKAVLMAFDRARPNLRGSWWNSEYTASSRMFFIQEQDGDAGAQLPEGRTEAFHVSMSIGTSRAELLEALGAEVTRKTVSAEDLRGRFDRGQLRITHRDGRIPAGAYVYTSMLVNNLWNDSTALRWDRLVREGDAIVVRGSSRRFPFAMEWRVSPGAPGELDIAIALELHERMQVQEFQTSLVLPVVYHRWRSPTETGDFPEIRTDASDWTHLNRAYAAGDALHAEGPAVPSITFGVRQAAGSVLTVLNSDFAQKSRVLQALSVPEHAAFVYEAGRHTYFSGSVRLGD